MSSFITSGQRKLILTHHKSTRKSDETSYPLRNCMYGKCTNVHGNYKSRFDPKWPRVWPLYWKAKKVKYYFSNPSLKKTGPRKVTAAATLDVKKIEEDDSLISQVIHSLIRGPNFMAWTIFFDFQNAGRQDATRESITGDDSLIEYWV